MVTCYPPIFRLPLLAVLIFLASVIYAYYEPLLLLYWTQDECWNCPGMLCKNTVQHESCRHYLQFSMTASQYLYSVPFVSVVHCQHLMGSVKCYDSWPGLTKVGRHTVSPAMVVRFYLMQDWNSWEPDRNLCNEGWSKYMVYHSHCVPHKAEVGNTVR